MLATVWASSAYYIVRDIPEGFVRLGWCLAERDRDIKLGARVSLDPRGRRGLPFPSDKVRVQGTRFSTRSLGSVNIV